MPLKITKTRLMRQRAIATPPPICNSKGIPAMFIQTCSCPEPGACSGVDIQNVTFPQAMAMVPGPPGTYGNWRYIDKEHAIDESGSWNDCSPPGTGTGIADIYNCDGSFVEEWTRFGFTFDAWNADLQLNFAPGHKWIGNWQSLITGLVYDTSANTCPP